MADNYLYAQRRPDPFQSLIQGFGAGQQIIGNMNQQQMAGMKNQMLQQEMEKQQAVKNALANYGQEGFNTGEAIKAVMPHDPELGIKIQNMQRTATKDQIESLKAGTELFEKMLPGMTDNLGGYAQFYQMMGPLGLQNSLPHPAKFIGPDGQPNNQALNDYIKNAVVYKDMIKQQFEPPKTSELKTGEKILTRQWNPQTRSWETIGEANRWDDKSLATITKQNSDGTTETITVGGKPGQQGMVPNPKTAESSIFKDLMAHKEDSAKLDDVIKNFNPQYQTYGGKFHNTVLGFWDKVSPDSMSKEQTDYLKMFSVHKADTYKIMNQMLNRLSGAAVSDQEMKRLTQQLPNAGTGVLDGDSPKQFESKLMSFRRDTDLAIARLTQWAKEGVIPDKNNLPQLANKLSLDGMETILKNRVVSIKAGLRKLNPQMTEDRMNAQATQQLKQEYNLK